MLGEVRLKVKKGHKLPGDGKLTWKWTPQIITDKIKENVAVARKVAEVRAPFVSNTFIAGQTATIGGNTSTLLRPVDAVVGYTAAQVVPGPITISDIGGGQLAPPPTIYCVAAN